MTDKILTTDEFERELANLLDAAAHNDPWSSRSFIAKHTLLHDSHAELLKHGAVLANENGIRITNDAYENMRAAVIHAEAITP